MPEPSDTRRRDIERLEARIEEQRRRIPPHSVQPAMLQELEELEAERDRLRAELNRGLTDPPS